jgi:ATP-dependent Lon protease
MSSESENYSSSNDSDSTYSESTEEYVPSEELKSDSDETTESEVEIVNRKVKSNKKEEELEDELEEEELEEGEEEELEEGEEEELEEGEEEELEEGEEEELEEGEEEELEEGEEEELEEGEEEELEEGEFEEDEEGEYDMQLLYLEKEHPELYEKFLEIRDYLVAEMPKIDVLLKTPMHMKDKARIIELFEMFCVCEPLTFEWIELKKQIKEMTERAVAKYNNDQKLDEEIKTKIEHELKELQKLSDYNEESFEQKIVLLNLPLQYKKILYKKYQLLQLTNPNSEEVGKLTEWLSTVVKIPFNKYLQIPGENVLSVLKDTLDREFYGMNTIKEQILIYVSNKLYNPNIRKYPLGLIGPPGTAKTSIALAISKALQFPFEQLSGGGLVHSDGIHGHAYTYVGSQTGDILKAIVRMQCMNGILFIDEFDKLPLEKNLNSILQLIDPVQNHNFKDNYVGDIPIDLSNIWYILSMNDAPPNQALKDRIYLVHIPGYTDAEKFQIMKHNTVPKLLEQYKLTVTFEDEVIHYIIRNTDGEGMRQCIHMLTDIICKILFIKQHPTIPLSFSTPLPENNIITMEIVNKLVKNNYTKTYNSMYI